MNEGGGGKRQRQHYDKAQSLCFCIFMYDDLVLVFLLSTATTRTL